MAPLCGDGRNVSNRNLSFGLLAAFAVLIGIIAGMAVLRPGTVQLQSGTLLQAPRPVPDFSLQGEKGAFTKADLAGHWSVIYVGYTHCPDVCPTTLAQLKQVEKGLGPDAAKIRFIFLSIDPARDTPEALAQYTHYFSPDFLAVTGPDPQLESLGASLGYVYQKVPGQTPQSYLMDHSSALILIDPQARLAGYLTPPFKTESLVADLRQALGKTS
ncbi:MAG: SCO family protein [Nevskia sp.]|nr:SCO family protein [Nevskia sp.]